MISELISGLENIEISEDARIKINCLIKNLDREVTDVKPIDTIYKFNKFIENNLLYIKPIEYRFININSDFVFHYISIIDYLNNMFLNESFRNLLRFNSSNNNDIIADIFDGTAFRRDIYNNETLTI